jgi:hypothetical protein
MLANVAPSSTPGINNQGSHFFDGWFEWDQRWPASFIRKGWKVDPLGLLVCELLPEEDSDDLDLDHLNSYADSRISRHDGPAA